jgi:hypothetical protein
MGGWIPEERLEGNLLGRFCWFACGSRKTVTQAPDHKLGECDALLQCPDFALSLQVFWEFSQVEYRDF